MGSGTDRDHMEAMRGDYGGHVAYPVNSVVRAGTRGVDISWPTPPVGDSLALFNRLGRIEEHLATLLARTAPKERAKPQKTDPDVLAALADLAAVIGVPTKPSARDALKAVVALHGKEKTLQALKATCFAWRNGKACQGSPPHFLAANLIAEAGKRCVATPATRPVETWRSSD